MFRPDIFFCIFLVYTRYVPITLELQKEYTRNIPYIWHVMLIYAHMEPFSMLKCHMSGMARLTCPLAVTCGGFRRREARVSDQVRETVPYSSEQGTHDLTLTPTQLFHTLSVFSSTSGCILAALNPPCVRSWFGRVGVAALRWQHVQMLINWQRRYEYKNRHWPDCIRFSQQAMITNWSSIYQQKWSVTKTHRNSQSAWQSTSMIVNMHDNLWAE